MYQARVLGEFPEQNEDALFSLAWIEAAREKELVLEGEIIAGLDVARFGSDDSALVVRQGACVLAIETWQGHDTMSTTGRVKAAGVHVNVDVIGVGSGVLVDDKGEWFLPVLFGLDAESEAIAKALAIDHNNLTMAGGDFDLWDYAKMWNQESYAAVLRSLENADVPPVTMSHEDIASYLRTITSGIAGKPFGEGITEGVELEALFKIRVPVNDAEEIEAPLKEFLEQFPQARMEKIV